MGARRRRMPRPKSACLLRREAREHALALLVRQPAEVELVVVAEELRPLRRRRYVGRRRDRVDERRHVFRRQRVEQVLVHVEVEHHVDAVAAILAEVLRILLRQHVRLAQHDRLPAAPLQEAPELGQVLEVLLALVLSRHHALDHERHGVQSEAGNAELQPEAHDAPISCAPADCPCSGRAGNRRSDGSSTRPAERSNVHVRSCTPGNTIPRFQLLGRFSDQLYQSR
jgi:hypothetical protein